MTDGPNDTPVTQRDIANVVGCSQNTVGLALRDSPRISREMRREIQKVARRLGYRANVAARSLRRGRSGLVGIVGGPFDHVRLEYVRRIFDGLKHSDYTPILGVDEKRSKPWYNAPWIDKMRELQVELLVSFAWHDEARLPTWKRQLPIVLSGFATGRMPNCDCLQMDRRGAGQMATEFLIEKGYRRIEMLGQSSGTRLTGPGEGYLSAMHDAGLEAHITERRGKQTEIEMIEAYVAKLKRRRTPTAVFVLPTALGALLCNAAHDAGLRVPDDLAVVGYDYMQWADRLRTPITTVEQPIDALVDKTVVAVQRRLANPNATPMQEVLPFNLIQRESS